MDHNILSKAITYRIKKYLNKLIHPSQTGFMAGRNIAHNITKILDVIDYTEYEKIDAVLITLDFEKAFDRVEINTIIETLKYFYFGEVLINWVKLLCTEF